MEAIANVIDKAWNILATMRIADLMLNQIAQVAGVALRLYLIGADKLVDVGIVDGRNIERGHQAEGLVVRGNQAYPGIDRLENIHVLSGDLNRFE